MWRRLVHALRTLIGRRRLDDDVESELAFHLETRERDLISRGATPAEARRQARLEFGGVEAYREASRRTLGLGLLRDLKADLIYATRLARRQPGFTAAA